MRSRFAIGTVFAVALAFVVVATWWFLLSSGPPDFARLRNDEQFNVLVITLDTVRADRLGAYGFEQVDTPAIDAMARSGILFRGAHAAVPMTLPSHTSIFSGTYPPRHGVRDNIGYSVPDDLTTLAEVFQAAGYRTAAFIGAFVLDSKWGLDQGFDTYYDDFDERTRGISTSSDDVDDPARGIVLMGAVQRPANEVVDAAIEWMDENQAGPFFLWVHLFDPHTPYEAPEPYGTRYSADPYLGEIAFTDSEVGRLLADLERRGEKDRTFVVLAGDHGESLGEHGEKEHGFFVYEEATHVPLIFSVPFDGFRGVERDDVVSTVDIMPTILDMAGLEVPAAVQGESLTALFDPTATAAPRFVYSEALYARLHFGWSELAAIQDGRHKLIMSSDPELYDLLEDPDEADDLATWDTALFDQLESVGEELLDEISRDSIAPELMIADEATLAKLASLGYLGGVSTSGGSSEVLASPREKIGIFDKTHRARKIMLLGEYAEAERLFREVLSEDPGVVAVYRYMGWLYTHQQRFEEAAAVFKQAVPLKPTDAYFYIRLAETQLGLGLAAEAETTMLDALSFVDPDSEVYYTLGNIKRAQDDDAAAIGYFEDSLALNPESSAAHATLATLYLRLGQPRRAWENARSALAIDDGIRGAHFTMAQIHEAGDELPQATAEYLREIANSPADTNARFNLAMIYRDGGQIAALEEQLNRILEVDPAHARGLLALGEIYLGRGTDYARAVEMVTAAVALPLQTQELILGYYILSQLHARLGDRIKSAEYERLGRALAGRGGGRSAERGGGRGAGRVGGSL